MRRPPKPLNEVLAYNPDTGLLTRRATGHRVGTDNGAGYLRFYVGRRKHYAHRVAWFLAYGVWPQEVDHINRNRADNRLVNLREITRSQNNLNGKAMRTSKTGLRGVHWSRSRRAFLAQFRYNGRVRSLGPFATAEDAYAAYCQGVEAVGGVSRTP